MLITINFIWLKIISSLSLVLLINKIDPLKAIKSDYDSSSFHTIFKRASSADVQWDHREQKDWISLNGSYCGGDRQSPVNLDTSAATVDKTLVLNLQDYDKLIDKAYGRVMTTGHDLKLALNSSNQHEIYTITGSAVDNQVYQLKQVHIHWGISSMSGSEHAIDGERFSAEIHFVHINANNLKKTLSNHSITVIGVIAKNGDSNPGLDLLLEAMDGNFKADEVHQLKSDLNLNHFLPKNTKSFFKYSGSLTTPPCNEIVNWIVMKDTITVSNEQIDKLRNFLVEEHGEKVQSVVRDIQPLQGRTLLQSDSGSRLQSTLFNGVFGSLISFTLLYVLVHREFYEKISI